MASKGIQRTAAVTSATTSEVLKLNQRERNFKASQAVTLAGGSTLTYSVEHTFDDLEDSSITPVWFADSILAALTANGEAGLDFPVTAVRLNVTAFTTGSATLTVVQAT